MLQFFAGLYYGAIADLEKCEESINRARTERGGDAYINKTEVQNTYDVLQTVEREGTPAGFEYLFTGTAYADLTNIYPGYPNAFRLADLATQLKALRKALIHELWMNTFTLLPLDQSMYYEGNRASGHRIKYRTDSAPKDVEFLFGGKVAKSFRSTRDDVNEAGNCYAVARYTACVFHCMRVVEKGLHAFVRHLNTKHSAAINFGKKVEEEQWGRITDEIQIAIESPKRLKRLNPIPTRDEMRFYATAAKEFEYFNEAWRKDVSHSRKSYDKTSALSVMEHVRRFMQILAENKLKE